MGQEKLVSSHKLTGLEVGNLEDDTYRDLPRVYTQAASQRFKVEED